MQDRDLAVRLAAFRWLAEQTAIHGDVLPRELLLKGFEFDGQPIHLISPQQGIFKPRSLSLPLSILTTAENPYEDAFDRDGLLVYRYRGTDPNHPDNVGLRNAFLQKRPLAYFHGIVPGRYLAVWPVYIVGDDPAALSFKVAVDDIAYVNLSLDDHALAEDRAEARRAYVTATVKVRLHQRAFRERVLDAYRSQCALCRLRHRELLDAAHILPDTVEESRPTIDNGISLCKLHHAAYDQYILGITPDYKVIVRADVLKEEDGPILQYGLQHLHNQSILLPTARVHWPNRSHLEWRYERFLQMS